MECEMLQCTWSSSSLCANTKCSFVSFLATFLCRSSSSFLSLHYRFGLLISGAHVLSISQRRASWHTQSITVRCDQSQSYATTDVYASHKSSYGCLGPMKAILAHLSTAAVKANYTTLFPKSYLAHNSVSRTHTSDKANFFPSANIRARSIGL